MSMLQIFSLDIQTFRVLGEPSHSLPWFFECDPLPFAATRASPSHSYRAPLFFLIE